MSETGHNEQRQKGCKKQDQMAFAGVAECCATRHSGRSGRWLALEPLKRIGL